MSKPNIFLDIDDVIFRWFEMYAARFNTKVPKSWVNSDLIHRRLSILQKEKEFWLNLPIKHMPDFQPKGFVSARGIPKAWTEESLKINNVPGRSNVNQVHWGKSKIDVLKDMNCNIFVEDKISTFKECNKNGIFCLLMDSPQNQSINTKYRIHDLKLDTILDKYHTLCKSM